jgi:ComF family protein
MTTIATSFQDWLNTGLGFFYPEICHLCESERATAKDGFVGAKCWTQVRFIRPPLCERCGLPFEGDLTMPIECTNCREMELHFSYARSAVVAKTVVLETIHRFKYQRALWFENFLANLLLREAAPVLSGQNWDFIVPVPLHPLKEREREFNQAENLARHLSDAVKIPVNKKLLRRVTPTKTQTRLTKQERAADMKGAFAVRKKVRLNGERVIVLDDVFTTGATASACAKALRDAGAGDVCVWTVARGL